MTKKWEFEIFNGFELNRFKLFQNKNYSFATAFLTETWLDRKEEEEEFHLITS